jgi:hypothetical protein
VPSLFDYGVVLSARESFFEKSLNDFEAARPIEVDGRTPHQGKALATQIGATRWWKRRAEIAPGWSRFLANR